VSAAVLDFMHLKFLIVYVYTQKQSMASVQWSPYLLGWCCDGREIQFYSLQIRYQLRRNSCDKLYSLCLIPATLGIRPFCVEWKNRQPRFRWVCTSLIHSCRPWLEAAPYRQQEALFTKYSAWRPSGRRERTACSASSKLQCQHSRIFIQC
jgi:hypothetical protein